MKLSYITENEQCDKRSHEIPTSVPDSELPSPMVVVQDIIAAKKGVEAVQRKRQLSVKNFIHHRLKPTNEVNQQKSATRSPPHVRPRTTIQSHNNFATASPSPSVQLSARLSLATPSSVTTDDVARALRAQTAPSKKNVRSICAYTPLYSI
jgi:hypothetical protein